jgi:hypothetical protein
MTGEPKSEDMRAMFENEYMKDWMEEHLPELRETVSGQRILFTSLVYGFVVGLSAHVGGYALLHAGPAEPLALLAELLEALGWSLWTGIVVVLFVQIIPEVKKRQIRQALEAYEALQREKARAPDRR